MRDRFKKNPRQTGFLFIMLVLLCSASVFAFYASKKSVSGAWIYASDKAGDKEVPSGFVVVDMSDVFQALENGTYDPNEPSGIGPIPEEPSYSEGDVVLTEVTADGDVPENTVPIKKMDMGNLKLDLSIDEEVTADLTRNVKRVEQKTGKTDAIKSVTLDEVSVAWVEHSVQPGETLFDLARNSGLTQADIIKANEISNPDRLSLGQLLLIPRSRSSVAETLKEVKKRKKEAVDKREAVVPLKMDDYVVKNGDSLWSIASKSKVTIDTLFGSNNMRDPDSLKPGMKLRIPNQNGIFYKVKKGDTLARVSQKCDVEIDKIAVVNNIDDKAVLSIGQELFLPGTSQAASTYKTASSGSRTSVQSRGSKGTFRWPVRGRINSPFGWRRHPISKRRSFHSGIDIKARRYTKIRAARSGRVSYSGWMGGYGRVVVIRHNSTYSTLYAHAQKLYVRKGQKISAGQVIALVGSSGRSTGPHLHFEVRVRNKPVNPLRYLR